ncbi:MAG: hypothetical protein WAQ33_10790 [Gaiellaceae bacterium]
MNGYDNDVGIQLRMTTAQAREFAERLTDDDFRDRLENNTRETLAEYGIEAAPGVIPDTVRLPERKELEDMLGKIPGGRGFRDTAYPGFIHPIMVLIFALAFLEESEDLG